MGEQQVHPRNLLDVKEPGQTRCGCDLLERFAGTPCGGYACSTPSLSSHVRVTATQSARLTTACRIAAMGARVFPTIAVQDVCPVSGTADVLFFSL